MEKTPDNEDVMNLSRSESSESFHSLTHDDQLDLGCENRDFSTPDFMKPQNDDNDHVKLEEAADPHSSKENKIEKDIYFIDEISLENLEKSLSEDDKKDKHTIALECRTKGNDLFKKELYENAALQYTEALRTCPIFFLKDRAIFYGNRAAARAKISKDELKGAIEDCGKAIELNPSYCKVVLRRARLNQEAENLDEALKDFQRVIELDSGNSEARHAVMVLPGKISERNEKMKEEMLGKLKDLGNMVLKPFGLSTNNFEMKEDPNSGGYSINFKQNPT